MIYISELVIHSIKELERNGLHTGRTNIQKMIFFSIKDIELLRKIYKQYHYGPFSDKVQLCANNLESFKFIEYNDGYSLCSFDKDRIKPNDDKKYESNISLTVKFLKDKNLINVKEIAAFAKVYYYVLPDTDRDEEELVTVIEDNAPFVWPSLMDYKNRFSEFIQLSRQLNSELQ